MFLAIQILIIVILIAIMLGVHITEVGRKRKEKHLVTIKEFWDGKERRTVERFDTRLDVDYNINTKPRPSKGLNISTQGIGLILAEKLEKGTRVRMQIKLPTVKSSIEVRGEIAWCSEVAEKSEDGRRSFSTGIRFTNIDPNSQEVLFEYIRNLENDSKAGERYDFNT